MKKEVIPNYMCALQAKIFIEPRFAELAQAINRLHEDISQFEDKDEGHRFLKAIDITGELQGQITLGGFVASLRLAGGIVKEEIQVNKFP